MSTQLAQLRPRLATAAIWSFGFVALLWLIEIIDFILPLRIDANGVRPLSPGGLWGILFAPFLHDDWGHLISNSGPALILTFVLILTSGTKVWAEATAIIWLASGLGTWLIGGIGTNHIGASGVIFGWVTFLILRGIFARRISQILLGIVIAVAYGYVLIGVFPSAPGVSWQGHLCGALGGVIAAIFLGKRSLQGTAESNKALRW